MQEILREFDAIELVVGQATEIQDLKAWYEFS